MLWEGMNSLPKLLMLNYNLRNSSQLWNALPLELRSCCDLNEI